MSPITQIIIDITILILLSIGILTSIIIFILIFYHRHQHPINPSVLLICNTYLIIILTSIALLDMYSYTLYGNLYGNISLNDIWCYIRAYILHVGLCSIYFSYVLQAIFRLFRIVFYQYKHWQNFRFILRLIIFHWIFSFIILIPSFFLHYFEYIPQIYACHISLINIQGTIFASVTVYFGPTLAISIMYCYIMYYIKYMRRTSIQNNHQRSNQRDLIVLRRIIILILILLFLISPIIILWLKYVISGYLHPDTYHMECLIFSISLTTLSLSTAFLNIQVRQLISIIFRFNRRTHPVILLQQPTVNREYTRQ